MNWMERWEHLKEEAHDRSMEERRAEMQDQEKHERWHWTMHHVDKSSGSETLDD